MKLKSIFLFTYCFLTLNLVSSQNKKPSDRGSMSKTQKSIKSLMLALKKHDSELFTVFDSITLRKILHNYQPFFEKFYSRHLRGYKLTEDDYFIDTAFQSILLYNNAQYLQKLHPSLIHIDKGDRKNLEGIDSHPLLKYAKKSLVISLKSDKEVWPLYTIALDTADKILLIAPVLNFGGEKPTPKIQKILQPFSAWGDTIKTIYRLDMLRQ